MPFAVVIVRFAMFEVREGVLLKDVGKMDLSELENARAMARTARRAAAALRETVNGELVLVECCFSFGDIKWPSMASSAIFIRCFGSSRCFEACVSAICKRLKELTKA